MKRYRKREPSFEAEQFLPEEGKPFPEGVTSLGESWQLQTCTDWLHVIYGSEIQFPKPGDYIVRSTEGEVFCMSEHDFNRTFVNEGEERC